MFETTLIIEPKAITLADTVIVTLRIVGTEALRVAVPTSILDESTSLNWNIAPLGSAIESRDGASYVWQQQFQLSPFIVGDGLTLQFSNLTVNSKPLTVPIAQVSVSTTVQSLTSADVRPVTPLELSPSPPATTSPVILLLGVLVFLGILLSVIGTGIWLRRKKVVAVPSPLERLHTDLQTWTIEANKASAQDLARRIRAVFAEPRNDEQVERFARLDRWMYSADVPTAGEMQAEIEYWRKEIAGRLTPPAVVRQAIAS